MNNPGQKENQNQINTNPSEAMEVSPDDLAMVTGGASFGFFDREKRKPIANSLPNPLSAG